MTTAIGFFRQGETAAQINITAAYIGFGNSKAGRVKFPISFSSSLALVIWLLVVIFNFSFFNRLRFQRKNLKFPNLRQCKTLTEINQSQTCKIKSSGSIYY